MHSSLSKLIFSEVIVRLLYVHFDSLLFIFSKPFAHSSFVMQECVTTVCGVLPGTGLPMACIFAAISGGIWMPPIVFVMVVSQSPILTGGVAGIS